MPTPHEEQLQLRIRELEKEVARLHAQIKQQRYGLNWIDVPEAFDEESENKIPTLEEVPELSFKTDDGKPTHILIEGDNYHALKCLNYTHRGKVDVIYIDPPYNTGSDGFIYKDKRMLDRYPDGTPVPVGSPQRHSYWLSFMHRRLELAKNLLSERGVIFISIDDNEQANLKLLCDEIMGAKNFIGQIILKTATDNNPSQINVEHEYMLCYCKTKEAQSNWERQSQAAKRIINEYKSLLRQGLDTECIQHELRAWIRANRDTLPQVAHYNNVDERGVYSSSTNSSNPHPGGYVYDIYHPITKKPCPKPRNGWRWPFVTFDIYDKKGEVKWGVDETTQPHIKKRIETATEYLRSLIYEDNRGTTIALASIFKGENVFDNPKPHTVLSRIFDFVSSKNSIILDFFAGSGTTMHATMNLNEEDGGQRQCILVQLNEADICRNVTYERNRRVMQGYTDARGNEVAGLGNSLKYYRTAFVGENDAKHANEQDRLLLSQKAGCLLALAENTLEETLCTTHYQLFTNGTRLTAVYFKEDLCLFDEFVEHVRNAAKPASVYVFCWGSADEFLYNFEDIAKVSLKSIPEPILKIYQTLNR